MWRFPIHGDTTSSHPLILGIFPEISSSVGIPTSIGHRGRSRAPEGWIIASWLLEGITFLEIPIVFGVKPVESL